MAIKSRPREGAINVEYEVRMQCTFICTHCWNNYLVGKSKTLGCHLRRKADHPRARRDLSKIDPVCAIRRTELRGLRQRQQLQQVTRHPKGSLVHHELTVNRRSRGYTVATSVAPIDGTKRLRAFLHLDCMRTIVLHRARYTRAFRCTVCKRADAGCMHLGLGNAARPTSLFHIKSSR